MDHSNVVTLARAIRAVSAAPAAPDEEILHRSTEHLLFVGAAIGPTGAIVSRALDDIGVDPEWSHYNDEDLCVAWQRAVLSASLNFTVAPEAWTGDDVTTFLQGGC